MPRFKRCFTHDYKNLHIKFNSIGCPNDEVRRWVFYDADCVTGESNKTNNIASINWVVCSPVTGWPLLNCAPGITMDSGYSPF